MLEWWLRVHCSLYMCIRPESLCRLKWLSFLKSTWLLLWFVQLCIPGITQSDVSYEQALTAHTVLLAVRKIMNFVQPPGYGKMWYRRPLHALWFLRLSDACSLTTVGQYRGSSATVVAREQLLLNRIAVPVILNAVQACDMMLWTITNFSVTLVIVRPSSNFAMTYPVEATIRHRSNLSSSYNICLKIHKWWALTGSVLYVELHICTHPTSTHLRGSHDWSYGPFCCYDNFFILPLIFPHECIYIFICIKLQYYKIIIK